MLFIDCDVKMDPLRLVQLLQAHLSSRSNEADELEPRLLELLGRFHTVRAGTPMEALASLNALPRLVRHLCGGVVGHRSPPVLALVDGIYSHINQLRAFPYPKPG